MYVHFLRIVVVLLLLLFLRTQHILNWDRRDSAQFPTNGYCVRVTNEMAGLGGNVHFSKVELQSEYLREFYKDWVRIYIIILSWMWLKTGGGGVEVFIHVQ